MSSEPYEWIRWLTRLQSDSDAVSRQVVARWTEWLNGQRSSTEGPDFAAWRDAVPGSIASLSALLQQVRGWLKGDEAPPAGVDMNAIKERVEILERELRRLKAKVAHDDEETQENS